MNVLVMIFFLLFFFYLSRVSASSLSCGFEDLCCFSCVDPLRGVPTLFICFNNHTGLSMHGHTVCYWSLLHVSLPADSDECSETPDLCQDMDVAICVDTNCSYYCECKPGYEHSLGYCRFKGTQGQCVGAYVCVYCMCVSVCTLWTIHFIVSDQNECTEPVNPCGSGGTCRNLIGNFTCDCHQGYIKNATGHSCLGETANIIMEERNLSPTVCSSDTHRSDSLLQSCLLLIYVFGSHGRLRMRYIPPAPS